MKERTPKYSSGRVIGKWSLKEILGSGGNAEVWLAESTSKGQVVALKIIRSTNVSLEPYRRFISEIELLTRLGDRKGILPMLDHYLPAVPRKDDPAWFAMPLAMRIKDALKEQSQVETIVQAVLAVADTLVGLEADGIFHRDIKPDNLFWLDDQWVIGDFGLAKVPDNEALTQEGSKLGPIHFLAPEMLQDASKAAGGPADVYSLAKTLWVLVTGQTFPPPGVQRIEDSQLTMSSYCAHTRLYLLDRLVEKATRHAPTSRPTMSMFAEELRAWLTAVPHVAASTIAPELRANLTRFFEQDEDVAAKLEKQRQVTVKLLDECSQQFSEKIWPIAEIFEQLGVHFERLSDNRMILDLVRSQDRGEGGVHKQGSCFVVSPKTNGETALFTGFGVEVQASDGLRLVAAHVMAPRNAGRMQIIWSEERRRTLGSAGQEHAIAELAEGLTNTLQLALDMFLQQNTNIEALQPDVKVA